MSRDGAAARCGAAVRDRSAAFAVAALLAPLMRRWGARRWRRGCRCARRRRRLSGGTVCWGGGALVTAACGGALTCAGGATGSRLNMRNPTRTTTAASAAPPTRTGRRVFVCDGEGATWATGCGAGWAAGGGGAGWTTGCDSGLNDHRVRCRRPVGSAVRLQPPDLLQQIQRGGLVRVEHEHVFARRGSLLQIAALECVACETQVRLDLRGAPPIDSGEIDPGFL